MKIEKKRIGVGDEEENMEKCVHVFLVNSWRMEGRDGESTQSTVDRGIDTGSKRSRCPMKVSTRARV